MECKKHFETIGLFQEESVLNSEFENVWEIHGVRNEACKKFDYFCKYSRASGIIEEHWEEL